MGVGPFSSESTATQKINTASDQAQIILGGSTIQGQGKGSTGGKNNKFAEAGGVAGDIKGLDLTNYKGKGDLTVNYTAAGQPAPAPAIPPATQFVPVPAPVSQPNTSGGQQPDNSPGIVDKLTDLVEPKGADGTRTLNKPLVFTILGIIIALGFGIRLIKRA